MSYTTELSEVLREHSNGNTYKLLQLKITSVAGKFQHRSSSTKVAVGDGANVVSAISNGLSGNQKYLYAYFTTDAFVGFSSNSYVLSALEIDTSSTEIPVDPTNVIPLHPFINTPTYTDLDNLTLSNL